MCPAELQCQSRVEIALRRINLINKSCEEIEKLTGRYPVSVIHPDFDSYVKFLESLPKRNPMYWKRKLSKQKEG